MILDSLAKAQAMLARHRRGDRLPDDDLEWALHRLCCFLAVEAAERRKFGESQ